MKPPVSNLIRRYAFAVLLSVGAAVAQSLLQPILGEAALVVALPAVVAAAWFGGSGPGSVATLAPLAFVAWQSGLSGGIRAPGTIGIVAIFLLTTLLVCAAMRHLRRYARDERRHRAESDRALRRRTTLDAVAAAAAAASTSADVAKACLAALMEAAGASGGAVVLRPAADEGPEMVHAVGDVDGTDAFVVPLVAAGSALGAVSLRFDPPREIEGDERQCLLDAGRRAALAIQRARLYDGAERARADGEAFRVRADAELQERRRAEEAHRESEARYRTLAARTRRLYSLSAALSEAITLEAVAMAVVRQGRSVVGAAAGSVAFVDGEEFETLYAEDYPPAVVEASPRFAAEPGLCTTAAVATRAPVLVGSFAEWQAQYPRSAATAADGGFTSAVALPLLVDGAPVGVLSFHFTVPVNFDQEYQALLTSVAEHASQAMDRARLYETAQRARLDAEAANNAKDDFLSIVSHELRTPLNAILGWGAMLRDGALDQARVGRATNAIVNNATRQARIIDDLLEVSRIAAGRVSLDLQELELGDIVRGAAEAMLPAADQRGIELRVDAIPQARVVADPNRLDQVFGNLLANAVKFTPAGGCVTVDGILDTGTVRIRIVDTGCGIEPDTLPHIFERFRQGNNTTARSVGGLGLGLFIARRLVTALQGRVTAESGGRGEGATFVVTLPVVAASVLEVPSPPPALADAERAAPVRADLADIRVLVVDDEVDAREMMLSTLGLSGAIVTTAESAREALAKLEAARVDVILADLAMPEEDGYELIRRIRAHADADVARLPAAAVTACARDDERQRALAAGFDLHVAKPLPPGALIETVARLARAATANA